MDLLATLNTGSTLVPALKNTVMNFASKWPTLISSILMIALAVYLIVM